MSGRGSDSLALSNQAIRTIVTITIVGGAMLVLLIGIGQGQIRFGSADGEIDPDVLITGVLLAGFTAILATYFSPRTPPNPSQNGAPPQ